MWGLQKKKNGKVVRKQQMQQQSPHRPKKKRHFISEDFPWDLQPPICDWVIVRRTCEIAEVYFGVTSHTKQNAPVHRKWRWLHEWVEQFPSMPDVDRKKTGTDLIDHQSDMSLSSDKKRFFLNYNILFVLVFKCPGFDITVNLIFFFIKKTKLKRLVHEQSWSFSISSIFSVVPWSLLGI